eukprot:87550_1
MCSFPLKVIQKFPTKSAHFLLLAIFISSVIGLIYNDSSLSIQNLDVTYPQYSFSGASGVYDGKLYSLNGYECPQRITSSCPFQTSDTLWTLDISNVSLSNGSVIISTSWELDVIVDPYADGFYQMRQGIETSGSAYYNNYLWILFPGLTWSYTSQYALKFDMNTKKYVSFNNYNAKIPNSTDIWMESCNAIDSVYIYSIGGRNDKTNILSNKVNRYHIIDDVWDTLNDLPSTRTHASCVIVNNVLVVLGGLLGATVNTVTSSIIEYKSNVWTEIGQLNVRRYSHKSFTHLNNWIISIGGTKQTNGPAELVELFDSLTGDTSITDFTYSRKRFYSVMYEYDIDTNFIFLWGGNPGSTNELFNDTQYIILSRNDASFPTPTPTLQPTNSPSSLTSIPSSNPSSIPSETPSYSPSSTSLAPSLAPSLFPSNTPSNPPTTAPSLFPSAAPSVSPSVSPTKFPSESPTYSPSIVPTQFPSDSPSNVPSISPSDSPSISPSNSPSFSPIYSRTIFPTKTQTEIPTSLTFISSLTLSKIGSNGAEYKDNNSLETELIVLIIGGIVIISILIIILYIIIKKTKARQKNDNAEEDKKDTKNQRMNATEMQIIHNKHTNQNEISHLIKKADLETQNENKSVNDNENDDESIDDMYNEQVIPIKQTVNGNENIEDILPLPEESKQINNNITGEAMQHKIETDDTNYNMEGNNVETNKHNKCGESNDFVGYEWIKNTLSKIDEEDWEKYLNNFKKHKITDFRLKNFTEEQHFKELIPEIGVRSEMIQIWKQYKTCDIATQYH